MLTPLKLSSTECAVLSEQTWEYHLADCLPKHRLRTWHLWSPDTKQPLHLLLWSAPLTLWLVPTSDPLWGLVQTLSMSFSVLGSWYFNTFLHLQCQTLPWPLRVFLLLQQISLRFWDNVVPLPLYYGISPILYHRGLPLHHAPSFNE